MSDPATLPKATLPKERRVALVIGCAAYENARPLQAPTGDAAKMASLLEALGFNVISGFNCDYIDFRRRFEQFSLAIQKADIALFYFSGHGVQDAAQRNYLLPVDAEIELPEDLDRTGIALDRIMTAIRVEDGVAGVILLDACRDNPFEPHKTNPGTKSVTVQRQGLNAPPKTSLHNILIAFATDAGTTALDGNGGKASPFTDSLLRHLGTPGKLLTSSLMAVRNEVREATQFKQVPWSQDSLLRDIILNPVEGMLPEPEPPPPEQPKPEIGKPQPHKSTDITSPDSPPKHWKRFGLTALLLLLIVGVGGFFIVRPDLGVIVPNPCVSETGVVSLICRVHELDSADKTTRNAIANELDGALRGASLSSAKKAAIVAALLDLTDVKAFAALSQDGRSNLLGRFALIPAALWQDPALIVQLDRAHRSIAALAGNTRSLLGDQTKQLLAQWTEQTGYRPKNTVKIVPQFAVFDRKNEWVPLLDVLSKGWGWTFTESERTTAAIGLAQVRYGPDSMLPLALLIAAQLNGDLPADTGDRTTDETIRKTIAASDLRRVKVVQIRMPDNQLELWIGK